MNILGAILMWGSVIGSGVIGYSKENLYLILFATVLFVPGYFGFRSDHIRRMSEASGQGFIQFCSKNFLTFYISSLATNVIAGVIGLGLSFLF
jgi:hypothetical protein